jgi:hypothetical protein
VKLMEDIDYYNKYPTWRYLQNSIDCEETIEGKIRANLQDSLIQREVFPDWISRSHSVGDTLEYYLKLNEKKV